MFKKYIQSLKTDKDLSSPAASSELDSLPEAQIADGTFLEFRDRISDSPDQVRIFMSLT